MFFSSHTKDIAFMRIRNTCTKKNKEIKKERKKKLLLLQLDSGNKNPSQLKIWSQRPSTSLPPCTAGRGQDKRALTSMGQVTLWWLGAVTLQRWEGGNRPKV